MKEDVTKYITSGFIEHNPDAGFNHIKSDIKVHRIIGEGNFVLTQCEYKATDKVYAHYSIYKLEDDKIAEHWSIRQEIPDKMMHNNGMF